MVAPRIWVFCARQSDVSRSLSALVTGTITPQMEVGEA